MARRRRSRLYACRRCARVLGVGVLHGQAGPCLHHTACSRVAGKSLLGCRCRKAAARATVLAHAVQCEKSGSITSKAGILLQEAMETCLIQAHRQLEAEAQRRRAIQRDLRFLRDSESLQRWERTRAAAAGAVQGLEAALPKQQARLHKLRKHAQRAAQPPVKEEPALGDSVELLLQVKQEPARVDGVRRPLQASWLPSLVPADTVPQQSTC